MGGGSHDRDRRIMLFRMKSRGSWPRFHHAKEIQEQLLNTRRKEMIRRDRGERRLRSWCGKRLRACEQCTPYLAVNEAISLKR